MTTFRIETTETVNGVYEIKADTPRQAIALLDKAEPMVTLPLPQGSRAVEFCLQVPDVPKATVTRHRQRCLRLLRKAQAATASLAARGILTVDYCQPVPDVANAVCALCTEPRGDLASADDCPDCMGLYCSTAHKDAAHDAPALAAAD